MILILGGSGYIGSELVRCLQKRNAQFRSVARRDCDYYDRAHLRDLIDETKPEFLINAAGYVGKPNVDACELNKAQCLLGNAALPGTIRSVCEEARLPWGHISTGCIYSGESGREAGYREDDPPNFSFRQDNCSFYSGCKALGEETLEGAEQCFIWRPRMPFDSVDSPKNYLSKIMSYDRLLDVRNSLTQLTELAEACLDCWEQRLDFGTYHLTNSGSITTREVVQLVRESGQCAKEFSYFDSVESFMQSAASAPRSFCVLDNQKAIDAGLRLRHVADAISASLSDWTTH